MFQSFYTAPAYLCHLEARHLRRLQLSNRHMQILLMGCKLDVSCAAYLHLTATTPPLVKSCPAQTHHGGTGHIRPLSYCKGLHTILLKRCKRSHPHEKALQQRGSMLLLLGLSNNLQHFHEGQLAGLLGGFFQWNPADGLRFNLG